MSNISELFLYTRASCSACDTFKDELDKKGLHYHLIDIDNDLELKQRYGARIPVLVVNNIELCEGKLDTKSLSHLLTNPVSS